MTIFAHQDDETFSAGGILAKYSRVSTTWAVSVTSDPHRKNEFMNACKILGANPITLGFSNIFSKNEPEIKEKVIETILIHKPDLIITHVDFDYHHEHRKLLEIVKEAVEWASHTTSQKRFHQVKSIWGAETTSLIPHPDIHIDISDFNSKRLAAIEQYESQSHKGGDGFYKKFHNARTSLRGIQANVEHAESFLLISIPGTGMFKPKKVKEYFS